VSAPASSERGRRRRPSESAALAGLVEGRVTTVEELARAMDKLEVVPFSDVHAAIEPTRAALAIAETLGTIELLMRARLVQSDIDRRLGDYVAAGQAVRAVLPWAEEHGSPYLLARTHRVLASFLRSLGDVTTALDHAVKSVHYLDEQAPDRVRAQHTIGLATLLDETGSGEEASRMYAELLAAATQEGDWSVALLVLNNTACLQYDRGHLNEAVELTTQMRQIEQQQGIRLDGMELDTIAQVELLLGRPESAAQTLLPVLDSVDAVPLNEQASLPECLLTLVEAQRQMGQLAQAQQTLDRARAFCAEHGLAGQATKVRQAQAELFANAGRYKEAYEEHRRFYADVDRQRTEQREQRAQLIQGMFQIEQATKDRDRLEELAFRDTLTGLRNRRSIDTELQTLVETYLSDGEELSIAMVDVDRFKTINDTYSHEIGDRVLVELGHLLATTIDGRATVGRLGGDEFLVLMPGLGDSEAEQLADRLRAAGARHDWTPLTGERIVTASFGVTTAHEATTSRSALLARADRNLYRAKRDGRDRVVGGTAVIGVHPPS
jgi:two-component system cell cycle response regulator